MQIELDSVVVHTRVRNSVGDLSSLMESFRKYGQLSPILINRSSVLIAGNRRLESARRLGWKSINATVVDKNTDHDRLELELEENAQRKDLKSEELRQAIELLHNMERASWRARVLKASSQLLNKVIVKPARRVYRRLTTGGKT